MELHTCIHTSLQCPLNISQDHTRVLYSTAHCLFLIAKTPSLMEPECTDRYVVYFVVYISYHGKNHHALYVETDAPKETGYLYHVQGSLLGGMKFNTKPCPSPRHSPSFESMTAIGSLKQHELAQFEEACLSIPPPKPQLTLGGRQIHPHEPLRTCQEWVAEAVEAVRTGGIIASLEPE